MQNRNLLINDIAISHKDEDLLNYYSYAEKVQKIIQGYANNPEPLTIGIYGKWGAGKSSLLNLVERHIEMFQKDKDDKPYIKFHYNPWLYQSKEEMLFDFFDTLTRKLVYSNNDTLKKAGKFIKKYSRYLKAVKLSATVGIPKVLNVGTSFEPYEILQRLGEDLKGEEKSLEEVKKQVDDTLKEANKKVVIFIDDVDRLDKDEIFTLFKLIKINADFKNLIFIICLDQDYVAKAIYKRYGKNVKSGKDFLEKIINIPLELPLVEEADLDRFVKLKLEPILKARIIRDEESKELYDSLHGSYFDSPREVVRIINSFAFAFFTIGDEVNVHDLFWIEYLKIKHIKTYKAIKKYATEGLQENLIFVEKLDFNDWTIGDKSQESGFRLELRNNHQKAFPIIEFLFPMVKSGIGVAFVERNPKTIRQLDTELRINHTNHFEKYLSYHTKGKISEIALSNLKALIVSDDDKSKEALELLEQMIQNSGQWKVVYRLDSEIGNLSDKPLDKIITFLINNINIFSETSGDRPNYVEIIQSIAKKLVKNCDTKKDLILSVAQKLDYWKLCWYLGIFLWDGNTPDYITEIENILITKVKAIENHPFFMDRDVSKIIMDTWKNDNPDEFKTYIYKHLNSKENIASFLKTFTHFWNGTLNGMIKSNDYVEITEKLELDGSEIYRRIIAILPEYGEYKNPEEINSKWSDRDDNTIEQNIEQFIYWHLLKQKQDEINNTPLAGPPPIK